MRGIDRVGIISPRMQMQKTRGNSFKMSGAEFKEDVWAKHLAPTKCGGCLECAAGGREGGGYDGDI